MTPSAIASRIVAYARAQADQLDGQDRYDCLILALGEMAKLRDDPRRRPSAFLRAIAILDERGGIVLGED
jgi:hypothetical protein